MQGKESGKATSLLNAWFSGSKHQRTGWCVGAWVIGRTKPAGAVPDPSALRASGTCSASGLSRWDSNVSAMHHVHVHRCRCHFRLNLPVRWMRLVFLLALDVQLHQAGDGVLQIGHLSLEIHGDLFSWRQWTCQEIGCLILILDQSIGDKLPLVARRNRHVRRTCERKYTIVIRFSKSVQVTHLDYAWAKMSGGHFGSTFHTYALQPQAQCKNQI